MDQLYRLSSAVFVVVTVVHMLFMLAAKPELAEDEPLGDGAQRPRLGGPQAIENQIESDRAARDLDLFEIPL